MLWKRWTMLLAVLCTLGLVAVACGSDGDDDSPVEAAGDAGDDAADDAGDDAADDAGDDAADDAGDDAADDAGDDAADDAAGENPFGGTLAEGEYGESYLPDEEILEKGLGGVGSLPEEERARNVVLATLARASTEVDQDLALECWQNNGCDTGTGGELKVGLADGQGGNVARQIFKMEFILQALTYPEIGEIGYTDANLDTQKAISDVRSFAAQGYDVILSYPDAGEALVPAYRAATEQGAAVVTWSGAGVGEPGTDYLSYSGSDLCALGTAWGEKLNEKLPDGGNIAIINGAPGNPLDPVQNGCMTDVLNDNIEVVAENGIDWSRQGYLEVTAGFLAEHDDLDAIVAPYGDAWVGGMRAFDAAGRSLDGLITVGQSDDNPLLCEWKERGGVTDSWTFVALLLEGRAALTAAMMSIAGYDVPPEIIFGVQLKPITEESCRTDIPPDGSPSSLVPGELQSRMYPE